MSRSIDLTTHRSGISHPGSSSRPAARGARKPSLGACRRGLATVEMAIIITLLLLLTLGVIEVGWMILKSQQISSVTRIGARVGAVYHSDNSDVQNAILAAMANAGLPPCSGCIQISDNIQSLTMGESFTVTVTYNYNGGGAGDPLTLGMPLVPKPATLSSSVTMVREGI
jgi:Flp pilus assembly protein TadG